MISNEVLLAKSFKTSQLATTMHMHDWKAWPMQHDRCCFLPAGSRPPAQMHGSLDEGIDESEQQEIQKIISEIHGELFPGPQRSGHVGCRVKSAAGCDSATA